MLHISDISFRHGERVLFDRASAAFSDGWKVGLVGRNGAGKSTLLRLIQGQIEADSGEINLMGRTRVGSVPQDPPGGDISVIDAVLAADVERSALLAEDATCHDGVRLAEIHARLDEIGAAAAPSRAASILNGLGFDNEKQSRPCGEFSGGWRMRVALAGTLFSSPDLLILDEPSNHLDVEAMIWLTEYLKRFRNTVLMVSHDRDLLNDVCDHIVHIDQQKLVPYTGNYDFFERTRAERLANDAAQQAKVAAQRKHMQAFVDRFKAKASKAVQAQSRVKMLERMTPITPPEEAKKQVFTFPAPEELSPPIINLDGAAVGYGGKPVLRRLNLRIDQDDRIALLGRNGEGKSTLSKLLAGKLEASEGRMTRSGKLRIGYFAQHQVDELHIDETPLQHIMRLRPGEGQPRLRARLAGFGLLADQAETVVAKLSGGQKARLSLLLATIDAPHLLILDEPTNHLDMESREALVEALTEYSGAVILVSHDMHLLGLVADRLWLVKDGAVEPYAEDLEEYRRQLLAGDETPKEKPVAEKPKRASREEVAALRAEVKKCEERMDKLNQMRDRLATKLAEPALYDQARVGELETWQKKYAEVMEGLDRAEAMWLKAEARLESAGV
jgi:ATP-binding cassette subfamily F protein 3